MALQVPADDFGDDATDTGLKTKYPVANHFSEV